jgi:hypothetical protein
MWRQRHTSRASSLVKRGTVGEENNSAAGTTRASLRAMFCESSTPILREPNEGAFETGVDGERASHT